MDLQAVNRSSAARRRLALQLSTLTRQPPLWQGKDGKTWDRLVARYTEAIVATIIAEAVRNRDRLCRGDYEGAHVTPSTVEFYAKHFYTAPAPPEALDFELIASAQRPDGSWDNDHLANLVDLHRLCWTQVHDAIKRSAYVGVRHPDNDDRSSLPIRDNAAAYVD